MSTRRLLSVVATAAVGVVAALAFASPANAHTVHVSGQSTCQSDGTYLVTWTIHNDYGTTATIASLSSPLDGVAVQDQIERYDDITGTQVVTGKPGDKVYLTVKATWADGAHWTDTGDVTLTDVCETPAPPPTTVPPTTTPPSSPTSASSPSAPPAASAPASSPASGGGLPVTGTPTIAVAGAALVLIAGGTLLVLLGRRRRSATQ